MSKRSWLIWLSVMMACWRSCKLTFLTVRHVSFTAIHLAWKVIFILLQVLFSRRASVR